MAIWDDRAGRVLSTILIFSLVLLFVYYAWLALITFVFALFFAYLLEPLVDWFQHRAHMHRGLAVVVVYLGIVFALWIAFAFLGPRVVQQGEHLSGALSNLSAELSPAQLAKAIGNQHGWSYQTESRVAQFLEAHQSEIVRWEQDLEAELAHLAGYIVWVALVPILAVFFLLSGESYFEKMLDMAVRRRRRVFVESLMRDVHDVLAGYVRGQIILSGIGLVVLPFGFEILGLPYAITLGVIHGLVEFIPLLGPVIGAVLVVVVAFISGYSHFWALLLFLGAWRLVQDYVDSPLVMRGQVQLPALAVLFGVITGAEVGGVVGVFLSIPAIATLRVVWLRWRNWDDSSLVVPEEPRKVG